MKALQDIKNMFSYKQKVFLIVCAGIVIGLGALFLYLLRAHTYIADDPSACVNCHIMTPYYASWSHSSHGRDATCNDCHVPHQNLAMKYGFKAMDGGLLRYAFRAAGHHGRRHECAGHHGQLHPLPHTAQPGIRQDRSHGIHEDQARRGKSLLGLPPQCASRRHELALVYAQCRGRHSPAAQSGARVAAAPDEQVITAY